MEVQKDFRDLLELFNKHKVDYITEVQWEQAQSGRVDGFFGDLMVHYVGRYDFITNRKALGRKKDMADLEAVGET
jgi:hypothetical protein